MTTTLDTSVDTTADTSVDTNATLSNLSFKPQKKDPKNYLQFNYREDQKLHHTMQSILCGKRALSGSS